MQKIIEWITVKTLDKTVSMSKDLNKMIMKKNLWIIKIYCIYEEKMNSQFNVMSPICFFTFGKDKIYYIEMIYEKKML